MNKFKHYKWTDENIEKLRIETLKSTSMRSLLFNMGFKEGNGAYLRLKDALKKFNISTSHFCRSCIKGKTFVSIPSLSNKSFNNHFCENSTSSRGLIKSVILKEKLISYQCSDCKIESVWNNKPINLHLDHINGSNNDNRLENLRFLCPNCHSQTITYCSNTQNRYSDEDILRSSVDCSSIRQVMLKMNMTTGTNYRRLKKLLPDLVRKHKDSCEKENIDAIEKIISKKISKLPRPTTRKVNRPSKVELEKLVEEKSILQISKDYGVSDNAIRKWCKSYNIEMKPVGYWQKIKFNNC